MELQLWRVGLGLHGLVGTSLAMEAVLVPPLEAAVVLPLPNSLAHVLLLGRVFFILYRCSSPFGTSFISVEIFLLDGPAFQLVISNPWRLHVACRSGRHAFCVIFIHSLIQTF